MEGKKYPLCDLGDDIEYILNNYDEMIEFGVELQEALWGEMSPLSSIPDGHQSVHSPSSNGTCVESTSFLDECPLFEDTTPVDVQAQSHTQDILSINDTVSNSGYDLLSLPYPQLSDSLSYPECYIPPEENCVSDVNVQHDTSAADGDTVSISTPSDTAHSCGSSDCVDAVYTVDCSGPVPDGIRRRPGKEVGPPIEEAEDGGCVKESASVKGWLEKAIRHYGSTFDRCTEGETSSQGARQNEFVYEQSGQGNISKFRFILEQFPFIDMSSSVGRFTKRTILQINDRCGIPITYRDYFFRSKNALEGPFGKPHICLFNRGKSKEDNRSCGAVLHSKNEVSNHFAKKHNLTDEDKKGWRCPEEKCRERHRDRPQWQLKRGNAISTIIRHISGDLIEHSCPIDGCGMQISGSRTENCRRHWDRCHRKDNKEKNEEETVSVSVSESEGEEGEGKGKEGEKRKENDRDENGKRKRQRKQ